MGSSVDKNLKNDKINIMRIKLFWIRFKNWVRKYIRDSDKDWNDIFD